MDPSTSEHEPNSLPSVFPETRWSLVLRAADKGSDVLSRRALDDLCRAYWRPVYAAYRSHGLFHEDAEDLTQTFFASLISSDSILRTSPERGRLRSFLQAALKHHLSHWRDHATAAKRGAGRQPLHLDMTGAGDYYALIPIDNLTPEVLYDRHWMLALMDRAMQKLSEEQTLRGRAALFNALKPALTAEGAGYAEIATRHGTSEAAIKMTVLRLRERLRSLIREGIAETVSSPEDVDDEIRHLFAMFAPH
jgi:RNA polymerase sigma-70 factor (ECF subfamily)